MKKYVLDGETVKLEADFTRKDGSKVDPDNLELRIYNSQKEEFLRERITIRYRVSAGVYRYKYVVPSGYKGQLVYEYLGYINGNPVVLRGILDVVNVLEDTRPPTLYGGW